MLTVGAEYEVVGAEATIPAVRGIAADCIVLTPQSTATPWARHETGITDLIEAGCSVVTTVGLGRIPAAKLAQACRQGSATVHSTGLHTFMIERMLTTMLQGVDTVRHVKFVEALDISGTDRARDLGSRTTIDEALIATVDPDYPTAIARLAHHLYGAELTDVRTECAVRGRLGTKDSTIGAIHRTHLGYLGDRHFLTCEEIWYLGPDNATRGDDLPYGGFVGPASYTVHIDGEPADSDSQWELVPTSAGDPIATATARILIDAIGPVCDAEPGVLMDDPTPRYQHDNRVR
jgi:4-hydroxy-tetrahydrodipicolinate reductase